MIKRDTFKYIFRELVLSNLIFTLVGIYSLILYGEESVIYLLLLKVVGFGTTFLVYYWNRRNHLYFFHNLSVRKRDLIKLAIVMDLSISVPLFILISIFS